jgi:hypothetical protein
MSQQKPQNHTKLTQSRSHKKNYARTIIKTPICSLPAKEQTNTKIKTKPSTHTTSHHHQLPRFCRILLSMVDVTCHPSRFTSLNFSSQDRDVNHGG